ncbi:MAG: NAD(P)/FAD-dependent oxidoreductase, partial [Planctomycetes bacterium]|nr:NAD(P)/FAD-dependent oxidoreductase [Planctomycetota bacterium]
MSTHNVIIGGGPVATNALETIRQFDNGASQITLICDEPAHSRMALPYWLSGQIPREQTHTADDAYYQKLNVDAKIGTRVQSVDPNGNSVTLSDGSTLQFDNLLIATGSSPVGLPVPGADLSGVQPLWSLDHTEGLLNATAGKEKPKIVMIGAGFIGFIMLNAMHKKGWELAVVERESHVLPRMLDTDAAGIVESWLSSKGIAVHTGASVQSISEASDGSKTVELSDGNKLAADVVIVAVGIKPNLNLIDGSGIETGEGMLVNDRMQTNFPNIYAGGDAAQGPSLYGPQETHAIQTTAVDHGRIAGANMAGEDVRYPGSLLMNILDVCGLQNASFGNWADPNAEAITICSPEGHVYRKLLFNGDEITGAIFSGRANDVGMLTDIGMVKGIMQTRTRL